jgi:hypothetical protein
MKLLKKFSSNQVVGTCLSVLFLNPRICPPPGNPYYGARTREFVTSRIVTFGEKLWQLRSIHIPNNGWFVFPFILNSGGSPWNEPILSDPVLRYLKLDRSLDFEKGIPEIPQPLGVIQRPLNYEWNEKRKFTIAENDLRFNLFGGKLVTCISTIHDDLDEISDEAIIRTIVHKYSEFGATNESVDREIKSVRIGHSDCEWTDKTVPLSLDVFF